MVSILVLLDDAYRRCCWIDGIRAYFVSILVLLDDAYRHLRPSGTAGSVPVSILVLLDDAYRLSQKIPLLVEVSSFNPCSSG